MSARLNLAPEVYQTSQRNKRKKQLATTIGIGIATACGGLIVLALVIIGGQALYIANVQHSINDSEQKIQTYPDLQNAATAQQHVLSLASLYDQKTYFSRFLGVLQDTAPQGVAISTASLNEANVLEVSANAKTYALATKYAKALEASNVEIGRNAARTNQPYFSNVQLASVVDGGNGSVDFKLTAQVSSEVTGNGQ